MIWPTEICLGPYTYVVEYVQHLEEVDSDKRDGSLIGQHDPWRSRVAVFVGPNGMRRHADEIFVTLLHELVHAIFRQNPLLRGCLDPDAPDEEFIDAFVTSLAELLVRNGMFLLPDISELPVASDSSR